MYLLISMTCQDVVELIFTLHPTMYLLILNASTIIAHCYCPLHPTMYLLILLGFFLLMYLLFIFTSHYVSINSGTPAFTPCLFRSLHPTMYLLIQITKDLPILDGQLYIPLCIY